ncbi:MAG: cache domain-containing protein [Desulfovibrio sp.]
MSRPIVRTVHFQILLPIVALFVFFVAIIFTFHMPFMRQFLTAQREAVIKDNTRIAVHVVEGYYRMYREGMLDRNEAQEKAAASLEEMRFGYNHKDYFWISTDENQMVMHPYRKDLVGTDLSVLTDSRGKYLFTEFINRTALTGESYVDYYWQLQDDPNSDHQKISYVKRFEPWGWIIGNGTYYTDIEEELRKESKIIMFFSGGATLFVLFLSALAIRAGIKAQRALEKREEEIAILFNQTFQFMGLLTIEGKVIRVNQTALDFINCQPGEVTGQYFWDTPWWSQDQIDLVKSSVEKAAQGTPLRFEVKLSAPDGNLFYFDASFKPTYNENGTFLFIMIEGRDITEIRNNQKQLKTINANLEAIVSERTKELKTSLNNLELTQEKLIESEKLAALGTLVAGVAHEINTPLGLSLTNVSYFQEQLHILEKNYREGPFSRSVMEKFLNSADNAVTGALDSINRAAELVQSFKQVAVEQNLEKVRQINLFKHTENIIKSTGVQSKYPQHIVSVTGNPNLVATTYPGTLMQILSNLIHNAVFHGLGEMKHGIITIHVAKTPKGQFQISVKDNGHGMAEDVRQKVFDPFFTTSRAQGNTGLGLHIVYNLVVKKLNGTITCTSQIDRGTTFTIMFPNMESNDEQ